MSCELYYKFTTFIIFREIWAHNLIIKPGNSAVHLISPLLQLFLLLHRIDLQSPVINIFHRHPPPPPQQIGGYGGSDSERKRFRKESGEEAQRLGALRLQVRGRRRFIRQSRQFLQTRQVM